ncbi:MAG: sensor domain-containing diguanylate cyclase [Chitinispirillales bacterium]|jgi:diguanylate cyclase (GGDEF)-like protein/PAS domain S-box-containing protein|nr:sensor domain-containing diguanylate cyclase [Chitinispirillales bacterium]
MSMCESEIRKIMIFFKIIPELGQILQRLGIPVSNGKALNLAMAAALVGSSALTAGAACAVFRLTPAWYVTAALGGAALLWNLLLALSISKQITADQADISKNRVLFRRFQNTTRYFESILQDSSDIIISLDADYLIFKFAAGAQNHLGYSQEEILGKPFEILFTDKADKDKMHPSSDQNSVNGEVPMKTKSGKTIVANMCVSKMRDGGYVVTAQDITEKKNLQEQLAKNNEKLNRLAITDDLTGLFNCRHFYEVIASELSRLKRHPDRTLSIIYLDIDKFKEYNDTEGHQMGDHVLKSLGDVVNACVRKGVDSGFRYGGDEFVVILPDTGMDKAMVAAERVRKQFRALKFGETSLSVGIAEAKEDDNETTLVRRADMAMYASKKSGKDRITLATDNHPEYNIPPSDTGYFPAGGG